MARRSELFLSYQWGEQAKAKWVDGDQLRSATFSTQVVVSKLKVDLERNTRLTCWLDLERMGAGVELNAAMRDGVTLADVFICCLTDRYLHSTNCLLEFSCAVEMAS